MTDEPQFCTTEMGMTIIERQSRITGAAALVVPNLAEAVFVIRL